MDADESVELDVARALVDEIEDAELFLYPGSGHLFAESSRVHPVPAGGAAEGTDRARRHLFVHLRRPGRDQGARLRLARAHAGGGPAESLYPDKALATATTRVEQLHAVAPEAVTMCP
jgi:hypothetical protein